MFAVCHGLTMASSDVFVINSLLCPVTSCVGAAQKQGELPYTPALLLSGSEAGRKPFACTYIEYIHIVRLYVTACVKHIYMYVCIYIS